MVPPPIQLQKLKPESPDFLFLIPIINKPTGSSAKEFQNLIHSSLYLVTTLVWATLSFPWFMCHGTSLGLLVSILPPKAILHTTAKVIMKTHSSLETIHIITKMRLTVQGHISRHGGAQLDQPQITLILRTRSWVPSIPPLNKLHWIQALLLKKGGSDVKRRRDTLQQKKPTTLKMSYILMMKFHV